MRERPILFSAPMVRAILDGRKTQTRRVVKNHVYSNGFHFDGREILCHSDYLPPSAMLMDVKRGKLQYAISNLEGWEAESPYGISGDRLWVRETWGIGSRPDPWGGYEGIEYRADVEWTEPDEHLPCHKVETPDGVCLSDYRSGWKPSIHMPRWACRLKLEITGVRVERLRDISEADARSEGADGLQWDGEPGHADLIDWPLMEHANPYRNGFALLWESINGDGAWASNPWVWVVEFKRVSP